MDNEIIKEILDFKENADYKKLSCDEIKVLKDYITNLQEENERLKEENKHIFANVNDDELLISNAMNWAEAQDYKSRKEKADWWLKEMLKQAKSNETKAIISGALELLLNGRSDDNE